MPPTLQGQGYGNTWVHRSCSVCFCLGIKGPEVWFIFNNWKLLWMGLIVRSVGFNYHMDFHEILSQEDEAYWPWWSPDFSGSATSRFIRKCLDNYWMDSNEIWYSHSCSPHYELYPLRRLLTFPSSAVIQSKCHFVQFFTSFQITFASTSAVRFVKC